MLMYDIRSLDLAILSRRFRILFPLVIAVILITGCWGCFRTNSVPTGTIYGKVTFRGNPVLEGNVHFSSPAGFSASALLEQGGQYKLYSHLGHKVPLGEYEVSVTPPRLPLSEEKESGIEWKAVSDIPEQYRHFATSELKLTAVHGNNEFNIDMK